MPSALTEMKNILRPILHLREGDLEAMDYVLCLALINTWTREPEPVWGYLVGPPSGGKTEMLRVLDGWPNAVCIDEMSENALASGHTSDGEDGLQDDPSLLPHLDGKILVIKDFTTIMSASPVVQDKTMGVLRSAYDGNYTKSSGKAGVRSYQCKFGMVAAVTPVIDYFLITHQKLGERFLMFRLFRDGQKLSDRLAIQSHARRAMASKDSWRGTLRTKAHLLLSKYRVDNHRILPSSITVSDQQGLILDNLADLVARLRTMPTKEGPVEGESGCRLVQQLVNMARARCLLDDRRSLDDSDVAFARRLASDTLPRISYHLFRHLFRTRLSSPPAIPLFTSAEQLSVLMSIPALHLSSILMQYCFLGICDQSPDKMAFRLTDESFQQALTCGLFLENRQPGGPDPLPQTPSPTAAASPA